jgi:hypothetical protein
LIHYRTDGCGNVNKAWLFDPTASRDRDEPCRGCFSTPFA